VRPQTIAAPTFWIGTLETDAGRRLGAVNLPVGHPAKPPSAQLDMVDDMRRFVAQLASRKDPTPQIASLEMTDEFHATGPVGRPQLGTPELPLAGRRRRPRELTGTVLASRSGRTSQKANDQGPEALVIPCWSRRTVVTDLNVRSTLVLGQSGDVTSGPPHQCRSNNSSPAPGALVSDEPLHGAESAVPV
jgi:hypothetical protein